MSLASKKLREQNEHLQKQLANKEIEFRKYRDDMTTLLGREAAKNEELKKENDLANQRITHLQGTIVELNDHAFAETKARRLLAEQYSKMLKRTAWQRLLNKLV